MWSSQGHHHDCGPRGRGSSGRGPWGGGDWGAFFGRFGDGGSSSRSRTFDNGELRLVLLALIAESPRHGYDLIKAVEERSGGAYSPSPGMIYPTLTLLDESGLIEEQKSEGNRRSYAVSEAGRTHLAERTEEVASLFARLDAMAPRGGDQAPIKRAVQNLMSALVHRVGRDGLNGETLHDVAEILDEAARRIERL